MFDLLKKKLEKFAEKVKGKVEHRTQAVSEKTAEEKAFPEKAEKEKPVQVAQKAKTTETAQAGQPGEKKPREKPRGKIKEGPLKEKPIFLPRKNLPQNENISPKKEESVSPKSGPITEAGLNISDPKQNIISPIGKNRVLSIGLYFRFLRLIFSRTTKNLNRYEFVFL